MVSSGISALLLMSWGFLHFEPRALELNAGHLRLTISKTTRGIEIVDLLDTKTNTKFLSDRTLPIFSIRLRNVSSGEESVLISTSGWESAVIDLSTEKATMKWQKGEIRVAVEADLTLEDSINWHIKVENNEPEISILYVAFPQLNFAQFADDASIFFPRGPGEVRKDIWNGPFKHEGLYPEPWTVMQYVSVYSESLNTGMYVGVHDPLASAKNVIIESQPEDRSVSFTFDHPVENMSLPRNKFDLNGEVVWKILRGDWFSAASIYRDWVYKEAKWVKGTNRDDSPKWMKELCVWVNAWGEAKNVVPTVKRFSEFMGVPVGLHWYGWHKIPFDNDYPHYFPTTEGFAEGVRELQKHGVFVMPYINGRLWDTRDKGTEDFEFSSIALPAATKDENGKIYIEMYGSRESDGSPVQFAAMCPSTVLWQNKVKEICMRLFNEYGVDGVYIDQVAAMSPRLCFDKAHGHPLGGGHWWVESYWKMLENIRENMPKEGILTTECNAEPYISWFDGYLTWTWQYDGQVPAFPAVYAGAIQMFGRAYRGGNTKDIALKMKAGQQLVFGEQIGWIDPSVIDEKENAEFMRKVVRLRWQLRDYFYKGQMLRPPRLVGDIPKVKADWQWAGEWWVTTDAILTGAWSIKPERKLVLIFVNVSNSEVRFPLKFNAKDYNIDSEKFSVSEISEEGVEYSFETPTKYETMITLEGYDAFAWEFSY